MKLSPVYVNLKLYALVYHTGPGSQEVELITNRFFKSEKKAWKWFHRKHQLVEFIEPEVVPVTGFNQLLLLEDQGVCMDHE
jgi:hypothetical protein